MVAEMKQSPLPGETYSPPFVDYMIYEVVDCQGASLMFGAVDGVTLLLFLALEAIEFP